MKNIVTYLAIVIKGASMGAADVIPGVSGGTIAFLMGIYKRLIDAIHSIPTSLPMLLRGKLKQFWSVADANFLIALFAGILLSIFSLAKLMTWLLANHPIQLWGFFFGLIIASSIYILKGVDRFGIKNILSLFLGIAVAAFICLASPAETTEALWFIFISGAIAICAMILPGVSGSFILLLLGKYEFVMRAVTEMNIPVLVVFATGAVIGLLSFSQLLSWLLKRHYMATLSLLSGFMIGSLIKVWPWKETLEGGTDMPVWPARFQSLTGAEPHTAEAFIFALLGAAAVFAIELLSKNAKFSTN